MQTIIWLILVICWAVTGYYYGKATQAEETRQQLSDLLEDMKKLNKNQDEQN